MVPSSLPPTTRADAITRIPLRLLDHHPDNPRGALHPADVQDLVESIRANGLLQPLVVTLATADGTHHVLVGNRRLAALRAIHADAATTVPAIILQGDDAHALVAMVTDNSTHQAPDAFGEASVVHQLTVESGFTGDEIASMLGKTRRWVSERRALHGLLPAVRTKLAKAGRGRDEPAPLGVLLEVARIAPEDQAAFVEHADWHLRSVPETRQAVARWTHKLKSAPWSIEDAEIDPKAGACVTCRKTDRSEPGLFDDTEVREPREATCRDHTCWAGKLRRWRDAKEAAARAKHPNIVLVKGDRDWGSSGASKDDRPALSPWEYKVAKKGAQGAVPAFVVDGRGAGSVRWVETKKSAKAKTKAGTVAKSADGKKPPGPTTAERLEALRIRRECALVDDFRGRVTESPGFALPTRDTVCRLLAGYGMEGSRDHLAWDERVKLIWHWDVTHKGSDAWVEEVWPSLLPAIESTLLRLPGNRDLADQVSAVRYLCGQLGIDYDELWRTAEAAVPTPKVLQLAAPAQAEPAAAEPPTNAKAGWKQRRPGKAGKTQLPTARPKAKKAPRARAAKGGAP